MKFIKDNQKRYEIKFIMNSKERNKFLKQYDLKTLYPDRIVESIYFDTRDLQFFNLSEEGVTPRLKVRIRGYNNGKLDNLEIKITKHYHREKIILKNFEFDNFALHENLKKQGIQNIVEEKIRVKYLRSYYELDGLGRITMDKNIEFLSPIKNLHNSKKMDEMVLEVKIQRDKIDKNNVEKIINLKESRFSKYCLGVNYLRNPN